MSIQLSLPAALARYVPEHEGWLRVKEGEPRLEADEVRHIRIHHLPTGISAQNVERWVEELRQLISDPKSLDLVTGVRLPLSVRQLLEQHGLGYLDRQGNLHLAWEGGVVHVTGKPRQPRPASTQRLGLKSLRAVQEILSWSGEIKVLDLAKRVRLSASQTHLTLVALEREGLLQSEGKGPNRRRLVKSRRDLLDWLAAQPAATQRPDALDAALYARRPEELFTRVTNALDGAGVAHGFTGAAAASVYGTGPTAIPLAALRIDPKVSLDDVAAQLGAEITLRGPNLRLIRDTGESGSMNTELRDGVRLAPLVRVYLDLKADRRGEDLAEQFREAQLGF